jgi:hypothetical protein
MCGLVGLGFLNLVPLALTTGLLLVISLAYAHVHALRLLKRTRWLLLSIFLFFSWGTPGQALWQDWPSGPTQEGVFHALYPLLRLSAAVMLVALLLRAWPPSALVSAFHALSGPLRWLGLDRDRMAVRLVLVLEYVQTRDVPNWRAALLGEISQKPPVPLSGLDNTPVRLEPMRWGIGDALGLVLGLVFVGWAATSAAL